MEIQSESVKFWLKSSEYIFPCNLLATRKFTDGLLWCEGQNFPHPIVVFSGRTQSPKCFLISNNSNSVNRLIFWLLKENSQIRRAPSKVVWSPGLNDEILWGSHITILEHANVDALLSQPFKAVRSSRVYVGVHLDFYITLLGHGDDGSRLLRFGFAWLPIAQIYWVSLANSNGSTQRPQAILLPKEYSFCLIFWFLKIFPQIILASLEVIRSYECNVRTMVDSYLILQVYDDLGSLPWPSIFTLVIIAQKCILSRHQSSWDLLSFIRLRRLFHVSYLVTQQFGCHSTHVIGMTILSHLPRGFQTPIWQSSTLLVNVNCSIMIPNNISQSDIGFNRGLPLLQTVSVCGISLGCVEHADVGSLPTQHIILWAHNAQFYQGSSGDVNSSKESDFHSSCHQERFARLMPDAVIPPLESCMSHFESQEEKWTCVLPHHDAKWVMVCLLGARDCDHFSLEGIQSSWLLVGTHFHNTPIEQAYVDSMPTQQFILLIINAQGHRILLVAVNSWKDPDIYSSFAVNTLLEWWLKPQENQWSCVLSYNQIEAQHGALSHTLAAVENAEVASSALRGLKLLDIFTESKSTSSTVIRYHLVTFAIFIHTTSYFASLVGCSMFDHHYHTDMCVPKTLCCTRRRVTSNRVAQKRKGSRLTSPPFFHGRTDMYSELLARVTRVTLPPISGTYNSHGRRRKSLKNRKRRRVSRLTASLPKWKLFKCTDRPPGADSCQAAYCRLDMLRRSHQPPLPLPREGVG